MRNTLIALGLFSLLCPLPRASAHYLWLTIDAQRGEHGTANIYFEESPAAGDGHYLDHFAHTNQTWFRSIKKIKPQPLETSDVRAAEKRWLRAELPAGAPRSVDCYGKFGVYQYGETHVLLHYYARNLEISSHEQLHELSRAEHMNFDIVPHDHQGELELTVLWRGKPAAGRLVYVRGPQRFKENFTTDERGVVRFTPASAGRYTFRSSVEEAIPGREGDQEYSLIRHNGTLIMQLPLKK